MLSLFFLVFVSDLFGDVLVSSPEFQVDPDDPAARAALFGTLLTPGLILTFWFGLGGGRRQLFEIKPIDALLCAPIPTVRVLAWAWLGIPLGPDNGPLFVTPLGG